MFTDTLIVRGKQNFEGEIFHYANGGKESVISLHSLSQRIEQLQYKYEIHSCFARWVSKNEEYPCPLEAGLPDMRVLDAVYRSKEEGRRIQI
ncbi:hypothetical protein KA005_52215 [bacterium]|nr:hypothetical protein [bacterium]